MTSKHPYTPFGLITLTQTPLREPGSKRKKNATQNVEKTVVGTAEVRLKKHVFLVNGFIYPNKTVPLISGICLISTKYHRRGPPRPRRRLSRHSAVSPFSRLTPHESGGEFSRPPHLINQVSIPF